MVAQRGGLVGTFSTNVSLEDRPTQFESRPTLVLEVLPSVCGENGLLSCVLNAG